MQKLLMAFFLPSATLPFLPEISCSLAQVQWVVFMMSVAASAWHSRHFLVTSMGVAKGPVIALCASPA